ncbi:hypothetical protein CK203_085648 [Vitis vinifera]|uniref:Uncharacterized protein n=1 Tax=Vitis vinifera TaxID=29760 RepID=A0A438BLL8_VITVI|nr:hypothetical protein CK203_085648 [Vitis vinifera]
MGMEVLSALIRRAIEGGFLSGCTIQERRSSGSKESNASNGARFGVETKKLQPLQVNHSKVLRNQPFVARISQPFVQCCGIPPEATRYMPQVGTLRTSSQPNSKDFSSEDERLGSLSLGVRKAGQVISVHGDSLVYPLRAFGGKSKVKDHLEWQVLGERYEPWQGASVINFVDYSLNQGAPAGHESAETPSRHESNGAVVGDRTPNQMVPLPLPLLGTNQMAPLQGMVPLYIVHAILNTIAEEAMNFMSYVAEFSREWDEPNARDMERMMSQPKAKGEMYILNDGMDMKVEIAAMERRLDELEMNHMQPVQAISQTPLQAMPCAISRSYEHLVDECPTIPAEREMFGDCNTYNSNWRDHPNFSWKPQPPQYQQPAQAPQQASSLEQAMVNLCKLDILQDSISRLANLNTMQEKENSPSQPYQNSMSIHEMEAQEGESSMVKEIKEVITLRSGKEVDLPTCKLEHKVESETEKEKREEIKGKKKGKSIEKDGYDVNVQREPQRIVIKEELMKKHMPPPFLQALYGKIIQTKYQARDANFIWDPGKLNHRIKFFDGLSLFKD